LIDLSQANMILAEFGIEVVPVHGHLRPGQIKSVITFQKIINARGAEHGRFLMMTWKSTMIKQIVMDRFMLWAMSDVILATERNFPDLMRDDVEKWFGFFDALQAGWLQAWVRDVDGIIPRRFALGGQIYERIKRVFGIEQADLLDDRRRTT
jgi:hypothetical protein